MSDDNNDKSWIKSLLKGLGGILVIFLVLVVVGFGLLVGFCGFLR